MVCEVMAVLSLFFGAVVLVFGGLLPVINPGFMEAALRRDRSFGIENAFAVVLGVLILWFAKWCSQRAEVQK
jgi:uncharacterized protein YjeT (DUF2065 family)